MTRGSGNPAGAGATALSAADGCSHPAEATSKIVNTLTTNGGNKSFMIEVLYEQPL
jgi:hypothetical protein